MYRFFSALASAAAIAMLARASPAKDNSHPPRVVIAGDSDVALWDPLPVIEGVEFVARGSGGDRTHDLLERLDRDVVDLHPDLAVITVGGNDLEDIASYPEQERAIIETCTRNIRHIVERLKRKHMRVVLLTILPYGEVPPEQRAGWSDGTYRGVKQVNDAMRSIAEP